MEPGMPYNKEWNTEYWKTRPVTVTQRVATLGVAMLRWQLDKRWNGEEAAAAHLRASLTRLGPAAVKIGQALSSRPDIIPPLYLAELETLQDDIPAFPSEAAFATIEAELQAPIDAIFSSISQEPVAAASLGQVYKATLRASGESVAVKVQRPGVLEGCRKISHCCGCHHPYLEAAAGRCRALHRVITCVTCSAGDKLVAMFGSSLGTTRHMWQTIALDIHILRMAAKWLRKARRLNSNLPALVDDWAASIYREMSYTRELSNAEEFRDLFRHYPEVYIPAMYPDLSTEKVLTMEWVDGSKPRAGSADVRTRRPEDIALVEVGVRCSLEQMLQEGFYHADPHPGNILRMTDGRLCYLDFGMMGRIERPVRQGLIRATLHMVNREFEELADDFVTLGLLPDDSEASREDIVEALTSIFNEALKDGVRNLNFGGLSANLGRTMYKYKFRIPPFYTLLVRSLTILEGIALASDPDYKVLGAAYPWVARRLLTDSSPELQSTLRNLLYDRANMFRFERLESLLEQAVRSPPRPRAQAGPVQAASSTAERDGEGALQLLLSDEGAYLRDIMMEEVAKGFDAAVRLNADAATRSLRARLTSAFGLGGGPDRARASTSGAARPAALDPSAAVMALLDVPSLADASDVAQVEGLQRLASLLQQLAMRKHDTDGGVADDDAAASSREGPSAPLSKELRDAANAGRILALMATEAQKLSVEQQRELLSLPLDLARRVSGRFAARGLRYLLSAVDSQRSPAQSIAASVS